MTVSSTVPSKPITATIPLTSIAAAPPISSSTTSNRSSPPQSSSAIPTRPTINKATTRNSASTGAGIKAEAGTTRSRWDREAPSTRSRTAYSVRLHLSAPGATGAGLDHDLLLLLRRTQWSAPTRRRNRSRASSTARKSTAQSDSSAARPTATTRTASGSAKPRGTASRAIKSRACSTSSAERLNRRHPCKASLLANRREKKKRSRGGADDRGSTPSHQLLGSQDGRQTLVRIRAERDSAPAPDPDSQSDGPRAQALAIRDGRPARVPVATGRVGRGQAEGARTARKDGQGREDDCPDRGGSGDGSSTTTTTSRRFHSSRSRRHERIRYALSPGRSFLD